MSSTFKIIDNSLSAVSDRLFNVEASREGGLVSADLYRGTAAVVTLGCAKNRVDSEIITGSLVKSGFIPVGDLAEADVIVVNTCGFLEASVSESIDCVLEAAEYRTKGRCRKLIVAGCVVERYRGDLAAELPEVDDFLGVDCVKDAGELASGIFAGALSGSGRPYFLYDDSLPRLLSTPKHTAYVKIADGCSRPCSFCIIPRLRGKARSRRLDSIIREVDSLSSRGVKEVNLVAQDLTSYGADLKDGDGGGKTDLSMLLREVDRLCDVPWVRLLYAYPVGVTDELLEMIVGLKSVVEYLDIPFQHVSEKVLRMMKRPLGEFSPRRLVERIRRRAPQVHLRSTFIVGFPGETEEDFEELESFIREGHFTSLGVFKYSRELGSESYDLPCQVEDECVDDRYARLMEAQREISEANLRQIVSGGGMFGMESDLQQVLIDGVHPESDLLLAGRTRFQAPEVDGIVVINEIHERVTDISPGAFAQVRFTDCSSYDLVGSVES